MKRWVVIFLICVCVGVPVHVVAQDRSSIQDFLTFRDYQWVEIIETDFEDQNRWEPRAGLQAVQLHDYLFVIAGRTPKPPPSPPFESIIHGDVWVSDDLGENWIELIADAEAAGLWRNRSYFEAVTLGDYIYIMGGQNYASFDNCPPDCPSESEFFNDVWRSADGVNWEEMTSGAPWAGRAGLSAVSFKGKLWVMAGSQGDDIAIGGTGRELFNDVWFSENGSDWQLAAEHAPWEPRAGGVVVVKDDWMYILGGEKGFIGDVYLNDVWRTQDGFTWEEATGEGGAGWSKRPGHKCSVLEKWIVCMGGFGSPVNPSDIWISRNGADWTQVSNSPWNNNPRPSCKYNRPPLVCDNIRYDFDILTVTDPAGDFRPSIFTFGGDREVFYPKPMNHLRIENDVWRFGPAE